MHDNLAAGVTWDLADLYAGLDDPRIEQDLDSALQAARRFGATYRGTIDVRDGPSPARIAEAVAVMEAILEQAGKACAYAELRHAADVVPAAHGALVAMTQEKASAIRQELLFFELEWLAVDEAAAQHVVDDPVCAPRRHFLTSLRRYRPHVLSEPEERILEEKANTGARAFCRLFDEVLSSLEFEVEVAGTPQRLNESGVLALLSDSRRAVRRAAAEALTGGLRANQLLLGFIFNTLVQDHGSDDRLRAYRDPMEARHLANEIGGDTVAALMEACEANRDIVQRYYRLKRHLLQLDELADYDRYAPLTAEHASVPWAHCREMVVGAYRAFAPRLGEIAEIFFDRRWIDAEVRSGKRGGAFSASTVPSVHPYVLVNYSGRPNDVTTVAHELGHGVHQYLARPRGYLEADTPLVMAETASVFGEMVVFEHLLRDVGDTRARLALVCSKVEDSIATVFRQVAMNRFEDAVHTERRDVGELSVDRFGELWAESQTAMLGDAVEVSEGYRTWWSYIPHFIHTPGYVYAYAYGQLLALSVYARYEEEGSSFVPRYIEMLSAGGSMAPEELGKIVGVDLGDPGFWDGGLDIIERLLVDTEEAAAAAGRV